MSATSAAHSRQTVRVADADAEERNEQLVSQLETSGILRDPAVASAFRAVLRHHFLPDRPLDEVYEDTAITTKMGDRGVPVSSSSQPAIMGVMLQQLQLKPGHRVLEIGAGTGFNAALIAHLVGRDGHVVTVDIDEDLCNQARANLAAAGVHGVEVVQADGAGGWPAAAPYDRMILTVSTTDLSPEWPRQLVDEGVLVVPLALAGPVQQSVAFVRHGMCLFSSEVASCGFMPLRGQMAPPSTAPDNGDEPWLQAAGRLSGYRLPAGDLRAGFESWLGLTQNAYIRPRLRADESPVFGLRGGGGAALVVADRDDFAIMVFGDGDRAAAALKEAHRSWAKTRSQVDQLRIEASELGSDISVDANARMVRRPHFTFTVTPLS